MEPVCTAKKVQDNGYVDCGDALSPGEGLCEYHRNLSWVTKFLSREAGKRIREKIYHEVTSCIVGNNPVLFPGAYIRAHRAVKSKYLNIFTYADVAATKAVHPYSDVMDIREIVIQVGIWHYLYKRDARVNIYGRQLILYNREGGASWYSLPGNNYSYPFMYELAVAIHMDPKFGMEIVRPQINIVRNCPCLLCYAFLCRELEGLRECEPIPIARTDWCRCSVFRPGYKRYEMSVLKELLSSVSVAN